MVYALVDCNNFYVSCERVFDPRLEHKPVVVLSNNDGCVIARSQEVKDLGVRMGTPAFEMRPLVQKHGVRCLSSNYTLYGDMSGRVMDVLTMHAPAVEIYSIDEAFLDLDGVADRVNFGRELKKTVRQWTGIPVAIGIAETKTLAKVANKVGKKHAVHAGVLDFTALSVRERDSILESVDVADVWGVGFAHAPRLHAEGIKTAKQFRDADRRWIKAQMGVCGLRTVLELGGVNCLPLELVPPLRKGITSSRSFSELVTTEAALVEAVATYVTRAAEKLRRYRLAANALSVFVQTNRFREQDAQYSNSAGFTLPCPSSDTSELISLATRGIRRIFREGYRYKKAGVMLTDLVPEATAQLPLFDDRDRIRRRKLMTAIDEVNAKMGSGILFFAAQGIEQPWKMRRGKLSPNYTSQWDELMSVRAG